MHHYQTKWGDSLARYDGENTEERGHLARWLSAGRLYHPEGRPFDIRVDDFDEESEDLSYWREAIWSLIVNEWMSFPFGDDFIIDWYDQLIEE